jgi:hypothetical protein
MPYGLNYHMCGSIPFCKMNELTKSISTHETKMNVISWLILGCMYSPLMIDLVQHHLYAVLVSHMNGGWFKLHMSPFQLLTLPSMQRDWCGTRTLVCYSTTQELSTYFGLILNIILSLISFVQIVIPIYNSFYKVLIEHVMGTKIMDKLRNTIENLSNGTIYSIWYVGFMKPLHAINYSLSSTTNSSSILFIIHVEPSYHGGKSLHTYVTTFL